MYDLARVSLSRLREVAHVGKNYIRGHPRRELVGRAKLLRLRLGAIAYGQAAHNPVEKCRARSLLDAFRSTTPFLQFAAKNDGVRRKAQSRKRC